MAVFTLADVRHGAKVYLLGQREAFMKSELENEPDYVWNDAHWVYLDHFAVIMTDKQLFHVIDFNGGEGYSEACDITAEEVVVLINRMCKGTPIELVK